MKWLLVVLVVLVACGGGNGSRDRFEGFPQGTLPACAPGPAWTATRCRSDRVGGDLAIRVVGDPSEVEVWARRGARPMTASKIVRNRGYVGGQLVWLASVPVEDARAIAALLVGADRVRCEAPGDGCGAPDALGAWYVDGLHAQVSSDLDGMTRYTPHWMANAPAPAGLSAVVLDPAVVRPLALTMGIAAEVAGKQLALFDLERPLATLATCDDYEVVGNDEALAVIDRRDAAHRWSWIALNAGREKRGAVSCADGVVEDRRDHVTLAVRPDTGVFVMIDDAIRRDVGADLRAVLEQPRTWPPCTDTVPLFAHHAPCTRAGTDDGLAWSVAPRVAGDRAIAWRVEVAGENIATIGDRAFRSLKISRSIARQIGGDVGCITPRRDCGSPDPLVRWLFASSFDHRLDDRGRVAPIWQPGKPALPPPGLAMVPYDRFTGELGEVALAYDLARDGPLHASPSCGTRTVWWSRSSGAVEVGGRWTWMYVAPDDPITGGSCDHDRARFIHADGTTTTVDVDGSWHTD